MRMISVISGDIVASRKIADKQRLQAAVDTAIARVGEHFGGVGMRFRGDAFQVALPNPSDSCAAAITLRASLIEHSPSRALPWDARVAIGIGSGDLPAASDFVNADGPAFVRSGQGLDALTQSSQRLGLYTARPSAEWDLLVRFADDIVSHWTHNAAEVVRHQLTEALSQSQLAARLARSQPTINRRLMAARWPLIQDFLAYMQQRLESEHE